MPRESAAARKQRVGAILAELHRLYADATCALNHRNAYELVVATILSAQCTDDRVNQVTPALFARYPDARSLAAADLAEVTALIQSTGFYNNKAKSLVGMATLVTAEHGGEIPDDMPRLLTLPGVARKTANVVLGTWFGKNEGVVVDTHVGRLSVRLRLVPATRDSKDAVAIEQDLQAIVPRDEWTYFSHALIYHGRQVCTARRPNCAGCTLKQWCPSAFQLKGSVQAGRQLPP